MTAWHLITGEFSSDAGGVGAHTEQLAHALARRGRDVHVWAPGPAAEGDARQPFAVHRLPGRFGWSSLAALGRGLDRAGGSRTVLIQYVPSAFGGRGLNVLFGLWALKRAIAREPDLRVFFHEPYFYFTLARPHQNVLAVTQRLTAVLLLAGSRSVYLSTSAWARYLRPYCWFRRPPMTTLPIGSTVVAEAADQEVAAARRRILGSETSTRLVGHFGTYGDHLRADVERTLVAVLDGCADVRALCLGRGSEAFVVDLVRRTPRVRGRIAATGALAPRDLSVHLRACDLLVQPFPDGVTTRRTSLVAGLAHGVAVATTRGPLTEPCWESAGAVRLAAAGAPAALAAEAVDLLRDDAARAALARTGHRFYQEHLSLDRTIEALLAT